MRPPPRPATRLEHPNGSPRALPYAAAGSKVVLTGGSVAVGASSESTICGAGRPEFQVRSWRARVPGVDARTQSKAEGGGGWGGGAGG